MKRPKHIRIYDSGPQDNDRYTVVYMSEAISRNQQHEQTYAYLGMNAQPFHPQGIGQHGECTVGPHLGKRIPWEALPEQCQKAVIQDTEQP